MRQGFDSAFDLLDERLRGILARLGYSRPTRIQELAIPRILSNDRHKLVVAPTGSGKTEAAVLPVISRIMRSPRPLNVIYVTPLRALNRDLLSRMRRIFEEASLSIGVIHGDTPQRARRSMTESPPNMIITTPETLQYLLVNERLRASLRNVEYLIVDEVHELVGSERGVELSAAMERLRRLSGRGFVRIGLSGSIGKPEEAAPVIGGSEPVEVIVDPGPRRCSILVVSPLPNPDQGGRDPMFDARIRVLEKAIGSSGGSVIVFTNTRDQAEILGIELRRRGFDVAVHHGSLSREERERAEEDLRRGRVKVVIATSSLELGIDVGSADLVIQYMSPRQAIKMLQRVGRSGHREWEEAKGVIVASENIYDIAESAVIARRACSGKIWKEIERARPREGSLDAMAHQIAGLVLEREGIKISEAREILSRTYAFRGIRSEDVERVARFLESIWVLRILEDRGELRLFRGRRIKRYYYGVSMIVDTRSYSVVDVVSNRKVGELDERFVAKEVVQGATIVLAGSLWRVVGVESDRVYVEAVEEAEASIPKWMGQQIPVDRRIAREVCALLRQASEKSPRVSEYPLDRDALERILRAVEEHVSRGFPVPGEDLVVVEAWRDAGFGVSLIHTCLGSKGNEALGLYIAGRMGSASYRATPYAVVIAASREISPQEILKILVSWGDENEIRERVLSFAKQSGIYRWHLAAAAKKMGIVDRDYPLDEAVKYAKHFESTIVGEEAVRDMIYEELDLEALTRLLSRIKRGVARVSVIGFGAPTPLGGEIYRGVAGFERVRSQLVPKEVLASLIKRRLEEKEARLVCIMCGSEEKARVKDLPERIACKRCGSVFVGVDEKGSLWISELVKKISRNPGLLRDPIALRDDEKEAFRLLRDSAELVANYGRRAVMTLMGRGVGPETAKRILRSSLSEEDMLAKIYEAEKNYIATKKYWD